MCQFGLVNLAHGFGDLAHGCPALGRVVAEALVEDFDQTGGYIGSLFAEFCKNLGGPTPDPRILLTAQQIKDR